MLTHLLGAKPRRLGRSSDNESRSESRRRFRYGGPWFAAATALPLQGGFGHPRRLASMVAATVRQPRKIVALVGLLLRTRAEHVVLTDSSAGRALRTYFSERFLGVLPQNRLCRGVLVLPQHHSDYLRGRRRQALRTNLRRAAAAGIRCEAISHPSAALDAALEVIDARHTSMTDSDLAGVRLTWPAQFTRPEMTLLVARDPRGRPLAVTAAVIDDAVCLIEVAVASTHEARWALHDELVRILIARDVRYLLAEGDGPFGALGFAAGLHHYQHLLGYELRHVIPRDERASSRRWGLPSLSAAAARSARL